MNMLIETFKNRSDLIIDSFLSHLYLSFVSMAIALIISIPLGIYISRKKKLAEPVIAVSSIFQTIPSLALFGLLVPIIGIGGTTAIVALVIYALLPLLRNTYTGITSVDSSIIEAGRGMGMTSGQIMRIIKLPLALPFIMAGIRTATVMTIGVATLATFVGAGGLGDVIYRGLQSNNNSLVLAGAIPVTIMALLFDFALKWIEKRATPKGLN